MENKVTKLELIFPEYPIYFKDRLPFMENPYYTRMCFF